MSNQYLHVMRLFLPFVLLLITVKPRAQHNTSSYFIAKTTGKLPMLAYGAGEDRLGGAKLGILDTGVVLKVVDSLKEMFVVKLANNHTAFIDKSAVTADTSLKLKPFYLTNSWLVMGDKTYDYVSINMDEHLPYKSWMEIKPSKIMVDLYGVQSNTNWLTSLQSAREIDDVYFNQVEDDVVRVTINLKHQQHWGYSIYYSGSNLIIRVRRQPPVVSFKKLRIAVDAGHGGTNTGATGIKSKTLEKDYTLRFAEELRAYLVSKKSTVIMTRTTDTNVLNTDRIIQLQKEMPDLLISLHLNSSAYAEVKGVSTYYKHIGFKPLTTSILKRMLDLNLNEFGNVGNFNFALNAPTDFPNSLVEIAFISNVDDEKKIMDPRFQRAVAKKIYRGIKDWIKSVSN